MSDILTEGGDGLALESGDELLLEGIGARSSTPAFQGPLDIRLKPWRFFLALSRDMSIIGELKAASGRQLTVDMNKSGSASFNFPMDDELVAPYIGTWRTAIVAQRGYQNDAKWFWSGPVSSVQRDYAAGTISVSAVGWFDLLLHRLAAERLTYAPGVAPRTGASAHSGEWDAGEIVADLIAYVNERFDSYITMGTNEVSQPRQRAYEVDVNIGQEIQSLSEIESGYDWYIDPRTRELNIVARRGIDLPNVRWIFVADSSESEGRSAQSNLSNVQDSEDGSTLANDIMARGKFSSAEAQSVESQDHYGALFQDVASLSDVVDPDILNAFVNAEIVYRQNSRTTYTLSPLPHTVPGVPLLFDDYDLGDTTYLTARRGTFEINDQAVRIFGVGMSIDENGVESITSLKTSADSG